MKNDCFNEKLKVPRRVNIVVFAFIVCFGILSGCGNKTLVKAKVTRPIELSSITTAKAPVYVNVKSEIKSGGEALQLDSALKAALAEKGYSVVGSPEEARLEVAINVLFVNNLREAQSIIAAKTIASQGAKAGLEESSNYATQSIAMSLRGIPTSSGYSKKYSNAVSDATKSGLIAGASIALVQGLAGAATKDDIYRAIIDVVVKETVITVISEESKHPIALGKHSRISELPGSESGVHKTRVFAEAIGNGLTLQEALPLLQVASANKIVELLK